jgi:hypothetical protein
MAVNASALVNFSTTGLNVGDYTYSLYALSAPGYLPLNSYTSSYLVSSYPALGALIVPVITPVSYVATARTMPVGASWISAAYGNGVFVAVGFNSSNAASSTDGITWTTRTLPSVSSWYHVAFGNGIFVAVSQSGTAMVATSTDGITWTQRTAPFGTNYSVCFGNGRFVTVGGGGGSMVSTDGINWTSGSFANGFTDVVYGNGVFVAVNDSFANVCLVSTDGLTTTATGTMPATTNYYAVEFGGGFFVAISRISGTMAARSVNGIDWVSSTLPTTAIWQNITYGNNSFLAIGNATNGATSPDGITWTARTLSSSTSWRGATFGAGKFVITSAFVGTTIAATIDYAVNATSFVLPNVQTLTGTTAYIKAT